MKTLLWINVNVVIYEAISAIFLVRSFRNIKLTCCIVNIKYVQEYIFKKKWILLLLVFPPCDFFDGREFSFSSPLHSPVLLFDMTFDLRLPSYLGGLKHVLSGFLGFSTVAKASQKMKDPGPLQLAGPKAIGVPEWSRASRVRPLPLVLLLLLLFFSWMNARASWSKKRKPEKPKSRLVVMMNSPFAFIRFTSTFCFCFEISFFNKEMNGLGRWEAKAIVAFHSKFWKRKRKKIIHHPGGRSGEPFVITAGARALTDANVKAPEMSAGQRHRHYYYIF